MADQTPPPVPRARPRKLDREPVPTRDSSGGGVQLTNPPPSEKKGRNGAQLPTPPPSEKKARKTPSRTNSGAKPTPDAAPNDRSTTAKRQRPKKLGPSVAPSVAGDSPPLTALQTTLPKPAANALNTEIEGLKSRVRELEGQVQTLYSRGVKSPRRRGRGGRGKRAEDAGATTATETDREGPELERLEDELEDAQRHLEYARLRSATPAARKPRASSQRPRARASSGRPRASSVGSSRIVPVEDEDEVEEIPRARDPGVEKVGKREDKAVALSGSYRIPLPSTLDPQDVAAVQRGVESATAIARSFLDKSKEQAQAGQSQSQPRRPRPSPTQSQVTYSKTERGAMRDGASWSQWFGSYSMSIAKFAKNVAADAAIEAVPKEGGRQKPRRMRSSPDVMSEAGPAPKSRPAKLPGQSLAKRPPLRGSGSGLSQEQVGDLMA